MNKFFDEVKGNFGFGCMRLPLRFGMVKLKEFSEMIEKFFAAGFNYFDTAHGYLLGKSEKTMAKCLTKVYPRSAYVLADKLSGTFFRKESDIRPFFEKQLRILGVEYFDFYLMHAQNANLYKKYKACRAYETAYELKKEGKIRHVGLSFHDKASVLDTILTEQPAVEFVQIQLNYVDSDDAGVEGKKCYEVCKKHGKPVIVMEPVKGGTLINLPDKAKAICEEIGRSPANLAIRYVAGFDNVAMTLSGMSNLKQMNENVAFMSDFQPLSTDEICAVEKIKSIFLGKNTIPCTGCAYCTEVCPKKIPIPDVFAGYNATKLDKKAEVKKSDLKKIADCIKCGKCEAACPQHLPIRNLLHNQIEK